MRKYLINYADKRFYKAQQMNRETGLMVGGFDECISLDRADLDLSFVRANRKILEQPRGAGYWLWKPYIIAKTLTKINQGDLLFYSDAGAWFINKIDPLLPILDASAEKMLLFSLEDYRTNAIWTKRDCFVLLDLDREPYLSYPQLKAGYIIMKKNNFVIQFINEWLNYARDYRILTDAPNECRLPNYPFFEDHRHDQSILSLLGRKYNLSTIPDIAQFGNDRRPTQVPQLMDHHGSSRDSWPFRIKRAFAKVGSAAHRLVR